MAPGKPLLPLLNLAKVKQQQQEDQQQPQQHQLHRQREAVGSPGRRSSYARSSPSSQLGQHQYASGGTGSGSGTQRRSTMLQSAQNFLGSYLTSSSNNPLGGSGGFAGGSSAGSSANGPASKGSSSNGQTPLHLQPSMPQHMSASLTSSAQQQAAQRRPAAAAPTAPSSSAKPTVPPLQLGLNLGGFGTTGGIDSSVSARGPGKPALGSAAAGAALAAAGGGPAISAALAAQQAVAAARGAATARAAVGRPDAVAASAAALTAALATTSLAHEPAASSTANAARTANGRDASGSGSSGTAASAATAAAVSATTSSAWESGSITPAQALKRYLEYLTSYEQSEVLETPQVYFVGRSGAQKIRGNPHLTKINAGYDDERGDYHVVAHDHMAYRFEVLSILGKGSFGQVLKCHDFKTNTLVAVKVIRNKKRFHQQALVELKVLEHLRQADDSDGNGVIHMVEHFYFRNHLCIAFELLSVNLYEFLKQNAFAGLSLGLIRRFGSQMLASLRFMKSLNIIHCDLKPENILLRTPNRSVIKVIDFGSSCYVDERVYTYIQSRFYRSPEVILGMQYGCEIDMWSFGCILAELYAGYPLFPGEDESEQLQCVMEVMGLPPTYLLEDASRRKLFFDSSFNPRLTTNSQGKGHTPGAKSLQHVLRCNDPGFLDLLEKCLKWDPRERITPEQALMHSWIMDNAPSPTARNAPAPHSSGKLSERAAVAALASTAAAVGGNHHSNSNNNTHSTSQHGSSSSSRYVEQQHGHGLHGTKAAAEAGSDHRKQSAGIQKHGPVVPPLKLGALSELSSTARQSSADTTLGGVSATVTGSKQADNGLQTGAARQAVTDSAMGHAQGAAPLGTWQTSAAIAATAATAATAGVAGHSAQQPQRQAMGNGADESNSASSAPSALKPLVVSVSGAGVVASSAQPRLVGKADGLASSVSGNAHQTCQSSGGSTTQPLNLMQQYTQQQQHGLHGSLHGAHGSLHSTSSHQQTGFPKAGGLGGQSFMHSCASVDASDAPGGSSSASSVQSCAAIAVTGSDPVSPNSTWSGSGGSTYHSQQTAPLLQPPALSQSPTLASGALKSGSSARALLATPRVGGGRSGVADSVVVGDGGSSSFRSVTTPRGSRRSLVASSTDNLVSSSVGYGSGATGTSNAAAGSSSNGQTVVGSSPPLQPVGVTGTVSGSYFARQALASEAAATSAASDASSVNGDGGASSGKGSSTEREMASRGTIGSGSLVNQSFRRSRTGSLLLPVALGGGVEGGLEGADASHFLPVLGKAR